MFTGIITEIGKVKRQTCGVITVTAPRTVKELKLGDSVSVNGVCLTAIKIDKESFSADLLSETVKRTNLGRLKTGADVNLELALRVGDRLGGHMVTGHVDRAGKIARKYRQGRDTIIEVEAPIAEMGKIILKGSVALNGVSLTIAWVVRNRFRVHLIPFTLKQTNLGKIRIGDIVNIETDKYLMVKKNSPQRH